MGQSLIKNYIHIIFSTKNRENLIDEKIENELFSYLGGICKNLVCNPIQIGSFQNHIHILCLLSAKINLSKLLEELKSHSSKWIKTKGDKYSNFYWQNGYGAFSVNPDQIDFVTQYILNQIERHKTKSFKEEYLQILRKYNFEFEEKYLWT